MLPLPHPLAPHLPLLGGGDGGPTFVPPKAATLAARHLTCPSPSLLPCTAGCSLKLISPIPTLLYLVRPPLLSRHRADTSIISQTQHRNQASGGPGAGAGSVEADPTAGRPAQHEREGGGADAQGRRGVLEEGAPGRARERVPYHFLPAGLTRFFFFGGHACGGGDGGGGGGGGGRGGKCCAEKGPIRELLDSSIAVIFIFSVFDVGQCHWSVPCG